MKIIMKRTGRHLQVPNGLGRALIKMQKATEEQEKPVVKLPIPAKTEPEPAPNPEPEPTAEETRTKRKYKRRDMDAEETRWPQNLPESSD